MSKCEAFDFNNLFNQHNYVIKGVLNWNNLSLVNKRYFFIKPLYCAVLYSLDCRNYMFSKEEKSNLVYI